MHPVSRAFAPARRPLPLALLIALIGFALCPAGASASPSASLQLKAQQTQINATVSKSTGVAASQIVAQGLCPAVPAPGTATCEAQALTLKGSHRFLHPRAVPFSHPQATQAALGGFGLPSLASPLSAGPASEPAPAFAPSSGSAAWLQQAYDTSWLSANAGAGDTVAIVDAYDDPTADSDLQQFRNRNGLPACTEANGCLSVVNEYGQTQAQATSWPSANSGWEGEEALDLAAVSAICPNCSIALVEANSNQLSDLGQAESTAASWPGVKQISNSWSGTGMGYSAGQFQFPGISVLASTGDTGYIAAGGSYPAGDPGVTAVGGTSLSIGANAGRGFTETAWSGSSSECATGSTQPSWQQGAACSGRSDADLSADGNPSTGLVVYASGDGGWGLFGGTSLASPLAAAFEAITSSDHLDYTSPQWAYTDASQLNDITAGSNQNDGNWDTTGACPANLTYLCNAGPGYDGPTGNGSISGDVATGGPGIGGPDVCQASGCQYSPSYTAAEGQNSLTLQADIYPNGLPTSYWWEYGTSPSALSSQTPTATVSASATPTSIQTSLTGLNATSTYYYRLVVSNADGTTYGYEYAGTTSNGAPVSTGAPVISGTVAEGQPLRASTGSWNPTPTSYAYQWQENSGSGWGDITGATSNTYTLTAGDLGAQLRAEVTGTNTTGSVQATSAAVGPVASGEPVNTVAPLIIASNIQAGLTLSLSGASWNPAATSLAYQWQRCGASGANCSDIAGATSATYAPTAGDIGSDIKAIMTATNSWGSAQVSTISWQTVQPGVPGNTSLPQVTGTAQRLQTLTASTGSWDWSGYTYRYQWQRCNAAGAGCADIAGATRSTYTPTAADEGSTLEVAVTASDANGSTQVTSTPTGAVSGAVPQNSGVPLVSGNDSSGFSVTPGSWTPGDVTLSYQWETCDANGQGCAPISGATGTMYMPQASAAGGTLRVVVTATNPDGSVTQLSAPSGLITVSAPTAGTTTTDPTPTAPATGTTPAPTTGSDSGAKNPVAVSAGNGPTVSPFDLGIKATGGSSRGVGTVGELLSGIAPTPSSPGSSVGEQFDRCLASCKPVGSPGLKYTLSGADAGALMRLTETLRDNGKRRIVYSSAFVGPVLSAQVAGGLLTGKAFVKLRSAKHAVFAVARMRTAKTHHMRITTVTVRRAVRGNLRVWVCPTALGPGHRPQPCTRPIRLGASVTIRLKTAGHLAVVVKR